MDEIETEKQKYTQNLSYDIIEDILSRLPVKSLLRFKAVSKQWESTISDPKFAEIHRRQSKNSSSCKNLLAWEADLYFRGFYVVNLENDKFQILSTIPHPWEQELKFESWRYCDGLFLKRFSNTANKTFVLWNLSSRTYKTFDCPYPIENGIKSFYGICYDPIVKDYKVVVTDMKHYAVFYCRSNKWTALKEMKGVSCNHVAWKYVGASFNGCVYWPVTTKRAEDCSHEFEIICFDGRDEEFKKLPTLDCNGNINSGHLASVGAHLFLYPGLIYKPGDAICIMKKDSKDDSWLEFKVQLPVPCHCVKVKCFMNENEIILDLGDPENYRLYNLRKETFADIQKTSIGKYSYPVPYEENLFLI